MAIRQSWIWAAALCLLAGLAWWALGQSQDRVPWITVEAPRRVLPGQPWPVHVRLDEPMSGFLSFDLHWRDTRAQSRGLLVSSGPQSLAAGRTSFDFELPIPASNEIYELQPYVVISRTGRWSERTEYAEGEPVRVTSRAVGPLRPLRMYEPERRPRAVAESVAVRRVTIFLLWGTAAASVLAGWRSVGGATVRRWAAVMLVVALAAALWEQNRAGQRLGNEVRREAREGGWYQSRRPIQRLLTAGAVAAAVALIVSLARARVPVPLRFGAMGLVGYAAVAFVGALSLHTIDSLFRTLWSGTPAGQALRFAAASVAFLGVAAAAISTRSAPKQRQNQSSTASTR